jgi:hypothetical protein
MSCQIRLPPFSPLLFTFHLSPALAQRVIGTLPNPSAHTLAIWQPAPGAIQTPLLSAKPATTWQSGKLPFWPPRPYHPITLSLYHSYRGRRGVAHPGASNLSSGGSRERGGFDDTSMCISDNGGSDQ